MTGQEAATRQAEKEQGAGKVHVATLTPFRGDYSPDRERLVAHCRSLLAQGADGLVVFGTTGEATSLSVEERTALLDDLIDDGVTPENLLPGTGAAALPDAVTLAAHAVARGCAGVMVLPPFYYKGVSDDGVFAFYAELIERVGDEALQLYLYHIPQYSGVAISPEVVERLCAAYPATIAGIKDSSGNRDHLRACLDRFGDLDIYTGAEELLTDCLAHGGAGTISGLANVYLPALRTLAADWKADGAGALQRDIAAARRLTGRHSLIASLKAVLAHRLNDPGWLHSRPPLMPLAEREAAALLADPVWAADDGRAPSQVSIARGGDHRPGP